MTSCSLFSNGSLSVLDLSKWNKRCRKVTIFRRSLLKGSNHMLATAFQFLSTFHNINVLHIKVYICGPCCNIATVALDGDCDTAALYYCTDMINTPIYRFCHFLEAHNASLKVWPWPFRVFCFRTRRGSNYWAAA